MLSLTTLMNAFYAACAATKAADLCAGKFEHLAKLVALPVHSALPCASLVAVHFAGTTCAWGRTA